MGASGVRVCASYVQLNLLQSDEGTQTIVFIKFVPIHNYSINLHLHHQSRQSQPPPQTSQQVCEASAIHVDKTQSTTDNQNPNFKYKEL